MIVVFLDKPDINDVCMDNCSVYKNIQDFEKDVKSGDFCLENGDSIFIAEFQNLKEYVYQAKFELVEKKTKK